MVSRTKRLQIGLTVLVMVMYSVTLLRNLHESERRSLQLREMLLAGDYVGISVRVVAVNLGKSELTARVSLRLNGDLAKDPVTPSLDLKLFLNGIRGPQEIEFPRGRRINPFEEVFPLDGNVNKYPFDSYGTSIWMMVTKSARSTKSSQTQTAEADKKRSPLEETASGVLVAAPLFRA
jgi:uncharacterized protein DUF4436